MDRDKKCYEEWIDIAKGIAMLAIMYSHIRSGISDQEDPQPGDQHAGHDRQRKK